MTAHKLKPQLLLDCDGGPTVWLVQHDREPIWLEHWYRLGCPNCGPSSERAGIVFDVREVPGFTEYPRFKFNFAKGEPVNWDEAGVRFGVHSAAERRHHAEIIASAFEAGWYPVRDGDIG